METLAKNLDGIAKNLAEAAELALTSNMSETLYNSMVQGIVAALPKPQTPHHIVVLKALKSWVEGQLITLSLFEVLQREVISGSRVGAGTAESSCNSQSTTTCPETVDAHSTPQAQDTSNKKKRAHTGKAKVQQTTLFHVLPDAKKTLVRGADLRKQREAALRLEDYEVTELDMASFQSEEVLPHVKHARLDTKLFACPKCSKTFGSHIGLRNHTYMHSESTKDRPAQERVCPPVECPMSISKHQFEGVDHISHCRQVVRADGCRAKSGKAGGRGT